MFYERLKSLALEKKLSLNQVEKNLKLSRNTLANYKKGDRLRQQKELSY